MKVYDLHVHSEFSEGESTLTQLADTAKALGYSGMCFVSYWNGRNQMEKERQEIENVSKSSCVQIFIGFEARDTKELRKLAEMRKEFDLLLVGGGDLELNRAAVETPEVDILAHPEYGRHQVGKMADSGLNHVLVKLAAKNNVAIEINFGSIFMSSGYNRAKVLRSIRQNIMLAKKFKAPIILCSGALSHFELRDSQSMISMATVLGMDLNEAKDAISKVPEKTVKDSIEKRGKDWVMPGVKVIKGD